MPRSKRPAVLTERRLLRAVNALCDGDPDLSAIRSRFGPPPLWAREPGFPTLVYIILEQQVSLASARAAFTRLGGALGAITPQAFLTLDDLQLKGIGFSRQKSGYCRGLARSIVNGELDLADLPHLDDAAARGRLLSIRGIGPWTADIYLLMVLLRPDIWPAGDLALMSALRDVKGLAARPAPQEIEAITSAWRPWRAVAARLLWHHYLSIRNGP